jgi:glycosyltransferase involved in cell wall biosynthesis
MKVLVFPRDDQNPYQRFLYAEMERLGMHISYLGQLTPSRTLNLLLLPLEIAFRGIGETCLVHLHWVSGFGLPGAHRIPGLRRLAQAWFTLWLRTIRLLRIPMVWTAHNVLPHAPVFADDIAARRALVEASDLVVAHCQSTLTGLASIGAVPQGYTIIPHGPLATVLPPAALRMPGTGGEPRHVLFFGKILNYKGVEDLLAAFHALPRDLAIRLTVAGQCDDAGTRARLHELAQADRDRVLLRLERIAEPDVAPLLMSADVVALPYRRVTTSGSAMLALAYGRPLILPELAEFGHLPRQAIVGYDGTQQALTAALAQVACVAGSTLTDMGIAASAYAATLSWRDIAAKTRAEMICLLRRQGSTSGQNEEAVQERHLVRGKQYG